MLIGVRDEAEDETFPEPSDRITADDAFPDDGSEWDGPDDGAKGRGLVGSLPGPLIAATTFVPTFLTVFFGLGYLLSAGTPSGPPAASAPQTAAPIGGSSPKVMTPPVSEAVRDPFVSPRAPEPAPPVPRDPAELGRPVEPREASREPKVSDAPPAVAQERAPLAREREPAGAREQPALAREQKAPTAPAPPPSLPARAPRESRSARTAEPPRQTQAAAPASEAPATVDSRQNGREWAPAAAFTDREAATRLANSIQQQGYPVEIRQDRSSTRPWVVWIGSQPRGGERRR